jgi:hypothetical protein
LYTSFNYSKEWNYNGIVSKSVSFNPAFESETAWSFPIDLGPTTMKFNGFFNFVSPKGKDGFGNDTKFEILTRPELMFDIGQLAGGPKNKFELGVAYEYWLNKFGNDNRTNVGALARTPMAVGKVHF